MTPGCIRDAFIIQWRDSLTIHIRPGSTLSWADPRFHKKKSILILIQKHNKVVYSDGGLGSQSQVVFLSVIWFQYNYAPWEYLEVCHSLNEVWDMI